MVLISFGLIRGRGEGEIVDFKQRGNGGMKKRGKWSEFHFSVVTSYKIHTLGYIVFVNITLVEIALVKDYLFGGHFAVED